MTTISSLEGAAKTLRLIADRRRAALNPDRRAGQPITVDAEREALATVAEHLVRLAMEVKNLPPPLPPPPPPLSLWERVFGRKA